LSAQLLGFVGTYGTVLGPMGAVIFVDFYLMKRFGLRDEYANRTGSSVNLAVIIAWLLPVAAGLYLIFAQGLFAAYAVIPCWVACGVIYLVLSKMMQTSDVQDAAATSEGT
jgi:NCS1 family nucleobase:cation symporter-1